MSQKMENVGIATMSATQLSYAHWLYNIPGLGSKTIKYLLEQMETPEKIYQLSERAWETLAPFPRKEKIISSVLESKKKWELEREYENLIKRKIQFTCLGDLAYPKRLADIPDAPYGLYYIGRMPKEEKLAVAIIGARSCSEYGRRMAEEFGRELACAGVQIISGLARGIDSIGQQAALSAGGYSMGVLGCGVDICYPKENISLYEQLCRCGGVCSEYLPGTAPQNRFFPPRNRIISGLADIVLVIEAKNRSGTLITVDMALEQGREVYALPGRVTEALSEGCNRLLKQGAAIALSPQDLLQDMLEGCQRKEKDTFLTDLQQHILNLLDNTSQSVENIREQLWVKFGVEISISELFHQLLELDSLGLIKQRGNSYFSKG